MDIRPRPPKEICPPPPPFFESYKGPCAKVKPVHPSSVRLQSGGGDLAWPPLAPMAASSWPSGSDGERRRKNKLQIWVAQGNVNRSQSAAEMSQSFELEPSGEAHRDVFEAEIAVAKSRKNNGSMETCTELEEHRGPECTLTPIARPHTDLIL
ncbi:hypothetical protein EYF80_053576 [Liparis tanakae]|uniref:Uncharacterized protein n=1 Tax=Liparis tanakae TaxID=230148 RepID=A0A4Z2F567_9TELE|nr:hypothetical protein EYF80_053576 [Liparis tanakae]